MKTFFVSLLVLLAGKLFSQNQGKVMGMHKMQPKEPYENVYVEKIASDSLASTFVVWIKKEVKMHKHLVHTENVYILEGEGIFTLGDKTQKVKKGDVCVIPMNTPHGVKITSKEPMKVISIQSPEFKGKDRIFIE